MTRPMSITPTVDVSKVATIPGTKTSMHQVVTHVVIHSGPTIGRIITISNN